MDQRVDATGPRPDSCRAAAWALGLLATYSGLLLAAELIGGPALARDLYSDILGQTRFHAVNTSLSVFLLAGGALLFLFTAARPQLDPRERRFFRWQAVLLLVLAADDRFLLHESAGERLGLPDALLLLGLGLAQLALLFGAGRLNRRSRAARGCIVGAALAFAVACGVDAFQDAIALPGRLSLEDLAKTWGGALVFGFAWCVCLAPIEPAQPAP